MPTGRIIRSTINRPESLKPFPIYANTSNTAKVVLNVAFIIFVKKYAYLK